MSSKDRIQREKIFRKKQIIAAAERLFFSKGYENTTMDDVSKEAEFSKRTLYSYFKSKEELRLEIVLKAFETLNSYIYDALEKKESANGLEKLRIIAESYITFSSEYPKYAKMIISYETNAQDFKENPELTERLYKEGDKSELVSFLKEGISDGSIRNDLEPEIFSVILWGGFTGVMNIVTNKKEYVVKKLEKNTEQIIKSTIDFWFSYMESVDE